LVVGYSVEDSEGGEELDVGGCGFVGGGFFSVVYGVEFVLVVLYEALFEDEFSSSDEGWSVFFQSVGV
jgi:hypothetical protein